LEESALGTFSQPFIEGIATPHRSRILGDQEESEPAKWNWAPRRSPSHYILLLVFGQDELALDSAVGQQRVSFAAGGLTEVLTLGAGAKPDSHEHFGFADGIGQPAIEGTAQANKAAARNVIKAGEILLSYKNDYGKPADSPLVSSASDRQGVLPATNGSNGALRDARDLGRNGTYLVFRQLAQHVSRFCKFPR